MNKDLENKIKDFFSEEGNIVWTIVIVGVLIPLLIFVMVAD